ncbi:MAG: 4'-phosphopantetheinyl transferase superfamily protein [Candidatus Thiodiazotropha sp. 'RUGA']|nr:4'-phosphopantetheinyl transferase superfamily protein [Candidatus Thiodiazotropha sp. 'RUGA']
MKIKLAELFPSCAIVVTADQAMWTTPLCDEEEKLIETAVEKRQQEFRAGRHAAHQALDQLSAPWQPLLRNEKRQPLWPTGFVGSISHCRGECVAVCAKAAELASLGIDVEPLEPLPKGVDQYIHTADDHATMQADNTLPERLIFSAKESLYKCFYPLIGEHMGFQSVSLNIDAENMRFDFIPSATSTIPFPAELKFHGRFMTSESHLYTGCYLTGN